MRDVNRSFMLKANWNLCKQDPPLWVDFVKKKYKCGLERLPVIDKTRLGSNFWRGLCGSWDVFCENVIWRIGDGSQTNFWLDHWLPRYARLAEEALPDIPHWMLNKKVSDALEVRGRWKDSRFRDLLPHHVLEKIERLALPSDYVLEDNVAWMHSSDGRFNLKSAFEIILNPDGENYNNTPVFDEISKWKGPERIKGFLWKLAHESVLTNVKRTRIGLATCNLCSLCEGHEETLFHLFRDCMQIKWMWNQFLPRQHNEGFYSNNDWKNWLYANLKDDKEIHNIQWDLLFGCILNSIWWRRNKFIFQNSRGAPEEISRQAWYLAKASLISTSLYRNLSGPRSKHNKKDIKWCYPGHDEVALNCDGAVTNRGAQAACAGLIRDATGAFICGFGATLGGGSVLFAELKAIEMGLKLAWSRGFRKIRVDSDSHLAIKFLSEGCCMLHPYYAIVQEIHAIHERQGQVLWNHILREANQAADGLAKQALLDEERYRVYHFAPFCISNALRADIAQIKFPRGF